MIEKTEIEKPQARRSSSPVDDFLTNFLKNQVITFGSNPKILEIQREWINYIFEQHAFEDIPIDPLIRSLQTMIINL